MTGPLIVDPDQVNSAAGHWATVWIPEFAVSPPDVSGSSSTHLAAQQAIAAEQAATQNLQQDMRRTAANARKGAGDYQNQEQKSAEGLKPGDITGVLGDLAGIGTGAFGVGPQVIGALTGLVGSGAGVIGSLTGAATSLTKQGHDGNTNNTNSEDSHPADIPAQQVPDTDWGAS